jgi:hypothetical protein
MAIFFQISIQILKKIDFPFPSGDMAIFFPKFKNKKIFKSKSKNESFPFQFFFVA